MGARAPAVGGRRSSLRCQYGSRPSRLRQSKTSRPAPPSATRRRATTRRRAQPARHATGRAAKLGGLLKRLGRDGWVGGKKLREWEGHMADVQWA
eukprot:4772261-Pleurochrysis_carterae.AAC.1